MSNKETPGYVYLICDWERPELYKIGVTTGNDVEGRRNELQTGNASTLHVCQYFRSRFPFLLESHLHRLFATKRTRGEWFTLTDEEALAFVETCRRIEENLACAVDGNEFLRKDKRQKKRKER